MSEKGGVSVYGLGRFPVTLYYEQWIRLLDSADDLRTFLGIEQEQTEAEERTEARRLITGRPPLNVGHDLDGTYLTNRLRPVRSPGA